MSCFLIILKKFKCICCFWSCSSHACFFFTIVPLFNCLSRMFKSSRRLLLIGRSPRRGLNLSKIVPTIFQMLIFPKTCQKTNVQTKTNALPQITYPDFPTRFQNMFPTKIQTFKNVLTSFPTTFPNFQRNVSENLSTNSLKLQTLSKHFSKHFTTSSTNVQKT